MGPMEAQAIVSVPQELIDMVLGFLRGDGKSLKACSLVCRAWVQSCHLHLFHKLNVNGRRFAGPEFLLLLQSSCTVPRSVRVLHVWSTAGLPETALQETAIAVLEKLPSLQKLTINIPLIKVEDTEQPLRWQHPGLQSLRLCLANSSVSEALQTYNFFSSIPLRHLTVYSHPLSDLLPSPQTIAELAAAVHGPPRWSVEALKVNVADRYAFMYYVHILQRILKKEALYSFATAEVVGSSQTAELTTLLNDCNALETLQLDLDSDVLSNEFGLYMLPGQSQPTDQTKFTLRLLASTLPSLRTLVLTVTSCHWALPRYWETRIDWPVFERTLMRLPALRTVVFRVRYPSDASGFSPEQREFIKEHLNRWCASRELLFDP